MYPENMKARAHRPSRTTFPPLAASVVFNRSTARTYGGGGSKEPILESTPALPADDINTGYARSKAAAERLVLAANSHVLHVVVLRPGAVYGLGDMVRTIN
jgi:nucleoside-diphosphate-sugar epimerase